MAEQQQKPEKQVNLKAYGTYRALGPQIDRIMIFISFIGLLSSSTNVFKFLGHHEWANTIFATIAVVCFVAILVTSFGRIRSDKR